MASGCLNNDDINVVCFPTGPVCFTTGVPLGFAPDSRPLNSALVRPDTEPCSFPRPMPPGGEYAHLGTTIPATGRLPAPVDAAGKPGFTGVVTGGFFKEGDGSGLSSMASITSFCLSGPEYSDVSIVPGPPGGFPVPSPPIPELNSSPP